jgi:hypothetical protein
MLYEELELLEGVTQEIVNSNFNGATNLVNANGHLGLTSSDWPSVLEFLGRTHPDGTLRIDSLQITEQFDIIQSTMCSYGCASATVQSVNNLPNCAADTFQALALQGMACRLQGWNKQSLAYATESSRAASLHLFSDCPTTRRQAELALDWHAQIAALEGDFVHVGRFALLRCRLATKFGRFSHCYEKEILGLPLFDGLHSRHRVAVVELFGFGDRIMLSRCYPILARRFPSIIFTVLCHPALAEYYKDSKFGVTNLHFAAVSVSVELSQKFDAYIPAPYIPEILDIADKAQFFSVPALPKLEEAEMDRAVSERVKMLNRSGNSIGLVYRDSFRWYQPHRFLSSIALLKQLARAECSVFLLDGLITDEELSALRLKLPLQIYSTRDLGLSFDFRQTAALITSMDCVVTIDKVFANLSGAIAHPNTNVALPSFVDYRWGMHGDGCSLYPKLKLLRQARHGDWSSVYLKLQSGEC